jgi:hypothetical protein
VVSDGDEPHTLWAMIQGIQKVLVIHHLLQNMQHMWLWFTTYHNTCNTCGFGSPPITTQSTNEA